MIKNFGAKKSVYTSYSHFKLKSGTPTEYAYYKGCSTFRLDATQCDPFGNGLLNDAQSCKTTCDDDFCNTGPVAPPVQCYVCDYTWDDFGMMGQGDANCMDMSTLTSDQGCPRTSISRSRSK